MTYYTKIVYNYDETQFKHYDIPKERGIIMTYEEIVESVRKRLKGVDTSSVKDLLAIQVNITGEGEGAFYVEVKDGVLSVEPYEYFDRQAKITMKSKNFLALMEGKLDPVAAFTLGKLKIDGSIEKVLEFSKLL